MKKIWIISDCEPLPCDDNPKLMRAGMLAEYLSKRDWKVTFWAPGYNHGKKENRFSETRIFQINENETLIALYSFTTYKKNTSPQRLFFYKNLYKEINKLASNREKPDLVFCSWPSIDFVDFSIRYGKKYNVPVIVDARDEWPDIFVRAFPKKIASVGKLGLIPMMKKSEKLFSQADVITSVQPAMLKWALRKAKRKNELDQYIYIGAEETNYSDEDVLESAMFWKKFGITSETWNICFYSGFSKNSADYFSIIEVVKRLSKKFPNLRLVLCGNGDAFSAVKEASKECDSIVLPGWCNGAQIQALLKMSKVGLYPMRNLPDFKDAIGNKFVGYLSEGLPILTSLEGYPKKYINHFKVGMTYIENDSSSCEKALEYLITHESERQDMAVRARQRFESDFDSHVVNRKFETLFNQCISKEK